MSAGGVGGVPVLILKEGTGRTTGKDAQRNNITAAKIVAETVRSTLGPRGMDKMLVSTIGDVTITNDGATIMKELDVQHPAAKMLVEVSKTQDNEVGDGTTTAVLLSGELLERAEKLLDKDVHPTVIVDGYKKAAEKAIEILDKLAIPISEKDDAVLRQVAITSMYSKGIATAKEKFADIAVKAVKQIAEDVDGKIKADIELIKILKKHGRGLEETELVKGIVVDKELSHAQMPKQVENAKIALLNAKLEIEKTEFDAKININNPDQMRLFIEEEEKMLSGMVEDVEKTGANVLFCEKGVDDVALHYLAKKSIATIKNVSSGDMEKLSKATGARIVGSVKELSKDALGIAKLVEEVKIGDDKLVYVRDAKNPKAVTIVIRGGTEHVVDEADRSLHDALCVVRNALEDGKIVAGGGAPEAELAKRLREYAVKVGGREQLAIEAFADALEAVPTTLAENAGLDPIDVLVELRSKHEKAGTPWFGVDVFTGKVSDMRKLNVLEPLRVKQQVVKSASEAASMILRIDDVIASKGVDKGAGAGGGKDFKPPGGGDEDF
ncbi:MAG: thermosome subunit [Crenarchaeota archaeon 13_1_40CM_3_53_5]|nr:MAG: thermosome subunit [Crenarchaeota archaeon 13_1_40CM_3_53_5]